MKFDTNQYNLRQEHKNLLFMKENGEHQHKISSDLTELDVGQSIQSLESKAQLCKKLNNKESSSSYTPKQDPVINSMDEI